MNTHALLEKHLMDDKIYKEKNDKKIESLQNVHIIFDKKLDNIILKLNTKPTKEEQDRLNKEFDDKIEQAMLKAIKGVGKWSYSTLLVIAGIVGAILVITGGAKTILGWAGINFIKQ